LKIPNETYVNLPAEIKEAGKRYNRDMYERVFSRRTLFATTPTECVICGEVKGKIYCHHRDGNPRNTDLSNLEWRCPSCHRKTHPSSFGTVKRTSVNTEQSTV